MRRGSWRIFVLAGSLAACAQPHWEHDVVVEITGGVAPPDAVAAAERAVARYKGALAPFGRGVTIGEPGDIRIEWRARAGAEHPLSVAYTDLDWEVDGALHTAAIHVFTDVAWSSSVECGTGYDTEAVLVHELGHAFGLWHSDDSAAVMHVPIPPCPEAALKRRLAGDDLDALAERYAR